MKKIATVALLLILCFAISSLIVLVNAEPSWVMWSQTYGGTADDGTFHLVYLVETSDGGYAIAGNTYSFGAGKSDFWLVKTDSNGNLRWNQTYGGAEFDHVYSLVETYDGGFALAGLTGSFGGGNFDFWLVKTDSFGNVEWNQTYGGTKSDIAYSVIETSDRGFALAGYTMSFGVEESDFWLVKTDVSGNMEWNQKYGGEKSDIATSLIETSDGGFALIGNTLSFGFGDGDFWLVKTDMAGNMEWNWTYGGTGYDYASSLAQTSDGGYALAGDTHSFGAGDADFWLIKTDASGNMEWNRTYGEANADSAHSLVLTSDGGFALAGETDSFGAGGFDFWLVKTDGSGNIEWSRTYGGAESDNANSLVQTSDGGYALAGNTQSFGAGGYDLWLVRTNEQGIPEFPSWSILPLLFAAALTVITCKKRLTKNKQNLVHN